MLGELRDPARQVEERTGSWHQTVEEVRRYKMSEATGAGLVTTSSHVQAQSMYLMYIMRTKSYVSITITLAVLYCTYLFQENKSYGSKKPFAFILWCTRNCVEHTYIYRYRHVDIYIYSTSVYIYMPPFQYKLLYGKWKMEICFPWSAKINGNRRLLFQQMCPFLLRYC